MKIFYVEKTNYNLHLKVFLGGVVKDLNSE